MYLVTKVQRKIIVPKGKIGNKQPITYEFIPGIPLAVYNKVGNIYLRDYPNIFEELSNEEASVILKNPPKPEDEKTNSKEDKGDFDPVDWLNNNTIIDSDKRFELLLALNNEQLIEISRTLSLRLPINTGFRRRAERINNDIDVRNSSES